MNGKSNTLTVFRLIQQRHDTTSLTSGELQEMQKSIEFYGKTHGIDETAELVSAEFFDEPCRVGQDWLTGAFYKMRHQR